MLGKNGAARSITPGNEDGYELTGVRVRLGTIFWVRVDLGASCPGYEFTWVQ